jgi:TFIIF-interacting CTD phosphatase-like protein
MSSVRSVGVKSVRLSTNIEDKTSNNVEFINMRENYNLRQISTPPRMKILCDLDATLINSLSLKGELQHAPKEFQRKFAHVDMKNYYRIFERPYLQYFLDFLFETFSISIFTAADKDYALFIADNIVLKKPGRKLEYLFFGTHSSFSESYYKSPKDLRLLWDVFQLKEFSPCNTIIIDDLDLVFKANTFNTIPAPKFELLNDDKTVNYDLVGDNFLLSVIPILEEKRKRFNKSLCIHEPNQLCYGKVCKKPGLKVI